MKKITISGIDVFVKRKNNKRMYLRVKAPAADVLLTAPHRISDEEISDFLNSNLHWIKKKQQELDSKSAIDLNQWNEETKKESRDYLDKMIPLYIQKWEKIMEVSVSKVTVRLMKSRWGSCNIRDKKITINLALAKKDPACLEYIIVHEMVHFFEKGHNQKFYSLMDSYLPDWKKRKEILNI